MEAKIMYIAEWYSIVTNVVHSMTVIIIWIPWLLILWPLASQIAKCMGPTWGPPGPFRPQMDPMLAPCTLLLLGITRSSATMVLIVRYLVSCDERFQITTPPQCRESIENTKIKYFYVSKGKFHMTRLTKTYLSTNSILQKQCSRHLPFHVHCTDINKPITHMDATGMLAGIIFCYYSTDKLSCKKFLIRHSAETSQKQGSQGSIKKGYRYYLSKIPSH